MPVQQRRWLIVLALVLSSGCLADDGTQDQDHELGAGSGSGSTADTTPGADATADATPGADATADATPGADATADATPGADATADAPADAGCAGQPEPACTAPDGYRPRNPGIPSGGQCRGACGADCPATCVAIASPTTCVEWQTADCGWHAKVCTYPAIECGTHPGCQSHDACYDGCTGFFAALCRRQCDLDCALAYPTEWPSWLRGGGPYTEWWKYVGTPTTATYDSTCY